MANNKQRYINTRFWNDNYISELDPIEKLLFIYFLTNEHTNIAGIYEIPLKIIGIETGIDESMLKKILPRLEDKIRYIEGMVIIKNFVRHQETSSDRVKTGILNCLKDVDLEFLKNIINKGFYILPPYYMDTLSIPYTYGQNYSNLDSNSNSIAEQDSASNDVVDVIEAFKEVNPSYRKYFGNISQRKAVKRLLAEHGKEKVLSIIAFLPKSNATKYAPTITTPCQLEDNLGKLIAWSQKLKDNPNKIKIV